VANAIVSRAKERLGVKLNDKIYISITDHLNFAIERHDQGIHFKNALLWEIKHYYKAEYEAGLEALVIIEDQLGLQLPKDEAGYFAMHFAASSMESGEMTETTDVLGLIQSLIQIVKYHFAREFDESTIHYERFLTHLKFFAQRVVLGKTLEDENPLLVETMKREYANEFSCSVKIHEFVKRKFNRSLSETELMYLTIHIRRISYQ
jgi:beta-glucoside operon transcriptional antiterminator